MMMAGYTIVIIINIFAEVIGLLVLGVVVFLLSKIILNFSIPARIRWLYMVLIALFPIYGVFVALLFPNLQINLPLPMVINLQ